jgi:uncharacterized protein YcbK (DUF882 family)
VTRGSAATGRSGRKLTRMCASVALAGAFVLAAESTQTAIANGDTRTISFYHTHSKESVTVTFKKNGKYDPSGLKKLNHFLRDWRNQKSTTMEPRLFDVIWEVQKDVGSDAPIQIISAFRSPETNEKLRSRSKGVAKNSQHTLGRAMDIHIPDANMAKVREAGLRLQRGGVGFYPSSHLPFVHLDVGNVRHWPRMSRDQLVRVFPDGRTVHIPSDGVPLKGYALAMAEVRDNGGSVRGMPSTGGEPRMDKGFFAKLMGADDDEDTPGAAPVPGAAPEAAPVAVAAIDQAVPMPVARPEEMINGGPQLASAYAPQQLPAGPEMIWRAGPDAGRAATSTTPGYGTDTTPSALVAAPQPRPVIDTNAAPVTASLAPSGNLAGERAEALRLLGMLREPAPEAAQPQDTEQQNEANNRIATAFDSFGPSEPQHTASVQQPDAPASAFAPHRTARDRALSLSHPNFERTALIASPAKVLPSNFGGNPNGTMRSDVFSGSPIADLRTVSYGPQRTALLAQ